MEMPTLDHHQEQVQQVQQHQQVRGGNTGNGAAVVGGGGALGAVTGAVDTSDSLMMTMGMVGGDDSPVSGNDDDVSDGDGDAERDDADSCDGLRHHHRSGGSTVGLGLLADHGDVLAKLKMQVRDIKVGEDFDQATRHLASATPTSTPTSHFNPRTSLSPSTLPPNFPLPVPFPFPHPAAAAAAAAFLPPLAAAAAAAAASHHHQHGHGGGGGQGQQQQQQVGGGGAPSSGSSHSSEGSVSSQHTWSFEEQFKQVRQKLQEQDRHQDHTT